MNSLDLAGAVLRHQCDLAHLSAEEQRDLLQTLVKGKVLLFGANPADPNTSTLRFPALNTDALRNSIDELRTSCDRQRHALLEAQAELLRKEIPLVLFKTLGPYPYTSSNVDALVPPGELDRAVRVLTAAGHHEMKHYWEPNKRLLRRFAGRNCEVMVHLHEQVSWIVLGFLDIDALWASAHSSTDAQICHPIREHLVTALLAHSIYESNRVNLGDLEKVRSALTAPGFDWNEVLRIARQRNWLPGLALSRYWYAAAERAVYGDSLLDDPEFSADLPSVDSGAALAVDQALAPVRFPVELSKRITKPYFFRKLLRDNPRSLGQKLWDLAGVFLQIVPGRLGLRRRPASFISLCGIDGSGKSTLAEALHEVLNECELPSVRVWMRGGFAPLTETLKRAARRTRSALPDVGDEEAKEKIYRSEQTRKFWAWWIAFEQILESIIQVRVPRLLGHTAVAERYLPDTLADLSQRFDDPGFKDRWPAKLMRWLMPRPDLVILLDLPGKVAWERKPDAWNPEILEARRQLYTQLLRDDTRVEQLDATRALADLEQDVIDRSLATVLDHIGQRNPFGRVPRDAWE